MTESVANTDRKTQFLKWFYVSGKKWNILRHRVDSVSYDTDQLVFGTIVFTILLFLLPTVMLYYIVFMIIRMTILIVQTMLYCVVYLNNFTVPHMLKAYPHQGKRFNLIVYSQWSNLTKVVLLIMYRKLRNHSICILEKLYRSSIGHSTVKPNLTCLTNNDKSIFSM